MPIPNHYAGTLSDLDLQMVRAIPSGGNWKNIPTSIPSKRLEQIRTSCAAGLGSRSTYYGRLKFDEPSYTINTYFNRPGNGCHIHPDYDGGQHRTISQREAARLQSFPDTFNFIGGIGSVNKQIGNAVPPLLAYQLAISFGSPGSFVDLFCGAGGLSLGFIWAGWTPVVGADIDANFVKTYRTNIHDHAIQTDLADEESRGKLVRAALDSIDRKQPLIVLGGPPCQGFSTAGNRRSMDDLRNRLFHEYATVLSELKPDAFLFENVPGLRSMEGGSVFRTVKETLASVGYKINVWDLYAHHYAVPQRRRRIILVGVRDATWNITQPVPITPPENNLFHGRVGNFTTVRDAIGDLPSLDPGEDGAGKNYISKPKTKYQRLMRGAIPIREFIANPAAANE